MNYAVIKTGGKQYKVLEGQVLDIDKIPDQKLGKIAFDQVLLLVQDGKTHIGKPLVNGAKIDAEVLESFKGEKLRVSKYKSKVRHRRTIGFRSQNLRVKIGNFGKSEAKTTKKATAEAKKS